MPIVERTIAEVICSGCGGQLDVGYVSQWPTFEDARDAADDAGWRTAYDIRCPDCRITSDPVEASGAGT
ncbi:hypothetical protein [Frankia sp. AvcI1]|uniref:hypothetical protein n=1 Tax=Frankia sp. AvcI1 TaxID=573496 RepID=UPI002118941C|nr:hypothetical protein [Frankia sp. AvcI1]